MLIGNFGTRRAMSAASQVSLIEFWEVLAFLANSALFLVLGLDFDLRDLRGRTLAVTVVAIAGMLAGRAVISFGLLPLLGRSRSAPIPRPWWIAVFWEGYAARFPSPSCSAWISAASVGSTRWPWCSVWCCSR